MHCWTWSRRWGISRLLLWVAITRTNVSKVRSFRSRLRHTSILRSREHFLHGLGMGAFLSSIPVPGGLVVLLVCSFSLGRHLDKRLGRGGRGLPGRCSCSSGVAVLLYYRSCHMTAGVGIQVADSAHPVGNNQFHPELGWSRKYKDCKDLPWCGGEGCCKMETFYG